MFKTSHECDLQLVGHTTSLSHVPDDMFPVMAARVSFGASDKTGKNVEADKKLMKYLADHKHMTPFEYQHATFLIECPLFIRSQIHRHRTFSFNEISRRYTDENLEFWIPDKWRGQHPSSKQASRPDGVKEPQLVLQDYKEQCEVALSLYTLMLKEGVCREQARAVLPQSLLTKFYMGGNLRNWAHFIELRRDEHAQAEVRIIADRLHQKLFELWPESVTVLLGEPDARAR